MLLNQAFSTTEYLEDKQTDWSQVLSSSTPESDYLINTIRYHNAYLVNAIDVSVVIYENNDAIAIWPLTICQVDNTVTLQSNCKNIIPPLFKSTTSKKVIKKILQQCLSFLKSFGLTTNQRLKLSFSPSKDILWQRILTPYIQQIDYQQYLIADITNEIEVIKASFRKSYRSLINKGIKLWECRLHTNMSDNLIEQFRQFHINISGKETRSKKTWQIQQEMVNTAEAFFITLRDDKNCLIGAALFNTSPMQASYSVGVYDRSLFELPLGHVVQFKAIEYMKELGVNRYFLGNRHHLFESPSPSKKQNSIGFFKEGFSNNIHIEANVTVVFT